MKVETNTADIVNRNNVQVQNSGEVGETEKGKDDRLLVSRKPICYTIAVILLITLAMQLIGVILIDELYTTQFYGSDFLNYGWDRVDCESNALIISYNCPLSNNLTYSYLCDWSTNNLASNSTVQTIFCDLEPRGIAWFAGCNLSSVLIFPLFYFLYKFKKLGDDKWLKYFQICLFICVLVTLISILIWFIDNQMIEYSGGVLFGRYSYYYRYYAFYFSGENGVTIDMIIASLCLNSVLWIFTMVDKYKRRIIEFCDE